MWQIMVHATAQVEKFYKVIIVLIDLILINQAYILAFLVKFNGDLPDCNVTPKVCC